MTVQGGDILNASGNFTITSASDFIVDANNNISLDADGGLIKFLDAGSEKMRLDATGLGIGTTSPDGQLHVKGSTNKTLKLDPTFSSGTYTVLAFARNGTDKWRVFHPSDDSYLSFFNENTSAHQLTLASDGNVGIGTTSPAFSLEVVGNSQQIARFKASNNSTSTNNGGAIIEIQNTNSTNGNMSSLIFRDSNANGSSGIFGYNADHSDGEGFLTFGTRNSSGTFGERMRISSGGDTAFYGDMSMVKDVPSFDFVDSNSDSDFRLRNNNGVFEVLDTTNSRTLMSLTSGAVITLDSLGSNTVLNTTGSVVIPNGSVGIGTTSPSSILDVVDTSGTTTLTLGRSGEVPLITAGGTNTDLRLSAVGSGGFLDLQTNGTSRMLIQASGLIGIGTTSPTNPLTIHSSYTAGILIGNTTNATAGRQNLVDFRMEASDNVMYVCGQIGSEAEGTWTSTSGTRQASLVFNSVKDGNNTERMRITSGGNVSINHTNTPKANLDVASDSNAVHLALRGRSSDNLAQAEFWSYDGSTRYGVLGSTSNSSYFGSIANTPLFFQTNSTERMRILSGGDVLISKTSSDYTSQGIELRDNGQLNVASTVDEFNFYNTSASAYRFYVSHAGTINATSTSISAISDISLKENIKPLETGLEEIIKLQPRRFDWKNGDGKNIAGFVAQEVEEVLPDLVSDYKYNDEENKKSVKMGDMLPTLVKAIQEQQAMIEELKAEIDELKKNK